LEGIGNAGLWDVNPQTTQTFQRAYERIQGLPRSCFSAAGASTPPLSGSLGMGFLIEGRPVPPFGQKNGQPQPDSVVHRRHFRITFATLRGAHCSGAAISTIAITAAAPFRGDHQPDHGEALLAE